MIFTMVTVCYCMVFTMFSVSDYMFFTIITALDEFRKPERKESVGTFYGSPHGASSGLRGVHVVSQARFHALKSLEERRLHPPADPSWIYRAPVTRQPVSEWTEPEPAPGKQRRRNSYSKKQFKKQRFKEIEEVKRYSTV